MSAELMPKSDTVEKDNPKGARAYEGSELELFSGAVHWKAYWSSYVAPFLGARVLDVGAGIGSTAEVFGKVDCAEWLALEPDPAMCDRLRTSIRSGTLPERVKVKCGTLNALSADERFDTILYVDVLEHIEDDAAELNLAARHVTASGFVVVLSPAHNWLYTPFDRAIGHHRRYNSKMLSAIKPDNLDLVAMRYFDSAGMMASLGNRMLLRSAMPTAAQIKFWDSVLVPISRVVDPLLLGNIGKSIIAVYKSAPPRFE